MSSVSKPMKGRCYPSSFIGKYVPSVISRFMFGHWKPINFITSCQQLSFLCLCKQKPRLIIGKQIMLYIIANRSLYRHAPNWFQTPLALQDTGTQRTTWRYSDLLAVLYLCAPCRIYRDGSLFHIDNLTVTGFGLCFALKITLYKGNANGHSIGLF